MTQPADTEIIETLKRQDGKWTTVELRTGARYRALNIAWGYDIDDEWAHVTTNVSPEQAGATIDFFSTSDVVRLIDEESGSILFEA